MIKFVPRAFEALIDENGFDDGGDFTFVFEVQALKKGKIYYEQDPEYLQDNQKNIVIDDNSIWYTIGKGDFFKKFKEIK